MTNMPNINKRQVSTLVDIETCRRVEKEFSRPGDTAKSLAFIRALEEATRFVELDADDYQQIADEVAANRAKRMRRCV